MASVGKKNKPHNLNQATPESSCGLVVRKQQKSIRTYVWWRTDQALKIAGIQSAALPPCEQAVGRCTDHLFAKAGGLMLLQLTNRYVQRGLGKKLSPLETAAWKVSYQESFRWRVSSTHTPQNVWGFLGARCAPVAAFLSWRRRDRLRFPMLLTVMEMARVFWHGQASKEMPCKSLLPHILAISLSIPIVYPQ